MFSSSFRLNLPAKVITTRGIGLKLDRGNIYNLLKRLPVVTRELVPMGSWIVEEDVMLSNFFGEGTLGHGVKDSSAGRTERLGKWSGVRSAKGKW